MLSLKKTARRCINRFCNFLREKANEKVRGEVSMYVYAIFIIMFLIVMLKASYDKQRVFITYDAVDDSIVEALTAASTYNVEELALGGQTVIFRTISGEELDDVEEEEVPLLPGMPTPAPPTEEELELQRMEKALENLQDAELFNAVTDSFLNKSRSDFMRALKRNLKLDGSMNCQLSGIEGTVTVEEFSIYNKYEQFDEEGNLLAFRIIRYTHNGAAWNVYAYSINENVSVYSSYDKANVPVENTTVTAKLSFDLYQGYAESDMLQAVHYQRLVDIDKD